MAERATGDGAKKRTSASGSKRAARRLVVVESPTKAKTLERYLGSGFTVKASYGHIRDLPKNRLGVDTEREFEPHFVVPEQSKKHVQALKTAHKRAEGLYLATDFDREGEAIAYHVAEVLGVEPGAANRVTFTEITPDAVREAFERPRPVDVRLVEAQQARRILDRLVGYKISPILWKKVRAGLSAGRVQSVALRLVVDREREIQAFESQEYWSVDARLSPDGDDQVFVARLIQVGSDKLAASPDKRGLVLRTEQDAAEHVERLRGARYRVAEVREKEVKRRPAAPFTTSTLQQEASRKLGFSARKTMRVAQQLYEGVNVPGEGQVGLITYMRTDSVNIAGQALAEIAGVVREQFGPQYALEKPRHYRTKARGAQEAHEAIRPTRASRQPDAIERNLDRDQARLYRLIWQRTVASQMAEARFSQVSVDVEAVPEPGAAPAGAGDGDRYLLRATGQTLLFDGFRRVYFEGRDDAPDEDAEALLPSLTAEQALRLLELLPEQHFTQPPPRFTEATLVKALEEFGIGRPSTYAPTISTLLDRGYVRVEDRRLFPEDVGVVVTDLLVEHFPEILDIGFTARMEEELDDVAEGDRRWIDVLDAFYTDFERLVEKKEHEIERPEEELDELCPLCPEEGREPGQLVIKLGRHGRFVGCRNYPECRYTREVEGEERPEPKATGETCPRCVEEGREPAGELMERVGRYGPFVGCSRYPECRYVKKEEKGTGVACPQCGKGELVQKRTRRGKIFYSCNRYPEDKFAVWSRPVSDPCPSCGGLMVVQGKGTKCTQCGTVLGEHGEVLAAAEDAASDAGGTGRRQASV